MVSDRNRDYLSDKYELVDFYNVGFPAKRRLIANEYGLTLENMARAFSYFLGAIDVLKNTDGVKLYEALTLGFSLDEHRQHNIELVFLDFNHLRTPKGAIFNSNINFYTELHAHVCYKTSKSKASILCFDEEREKIFENKIKLIRPLYVNRVKVRTPILRDIVNVEFDKE